MVSVRLAAPSSVGGSTYRCNEQRNRQIEDILQGGSGRNKPAAEQRDPLTAMARRLRAGSRNERLMAAYDIGQLGDPEGVPVVVPALADQEPEVRRVALRSLRHLAAQRLPQAADIAPLFNENDFLIALPQQKAFAQLGIRQTGRTVLHNYKTNINPWFALP